MLNPDSVLVIVEVTKTMNNAIIFQIYCTLTFLDFWRR